MEMLQDAPPEVQAMAKDVLEGVNRIKASLGKLEGTNQPGGSVAHTSQMAGMLAGLSANDMLQAEVAKRWAERGLTGKNK